MSTPDEPQGLGAVVEASLATPDRSLLVLVGALGSDHPWVSVEFGGCFAWSDLTDPVILHEGYLPPTPEPTGWGAVVLSSNGHAWLRRPSITSRDWAWWRKGSAGAVRWSTIPQPVEVLFAGVSE